MAPDIKAPVAALLLAAGGYQTVTSFIPNILAALARHERRPSREQGLPPRFPAPSGCRLRRAGQAGCGTIGLHEGHHIRACAANQGRPPVPGTTATPMCGMAFTGNPVDDLRAIFTNPGPGQKVQ